MESLANTILTIAVLEKFLPKGSADDLTSLVIPIALIESMQNGGMGGAATSATGSGDQFSSLLTTIVALSFLPKQESGGTIATK